MTPDNVIAFRGHALKKHEYGYGGSPYKLELLGLITALEDYSDYLYGETEPTTIYTDHKALPSAPRTNVTESRPWQASSKIWSETKTLTVA